MNFGHVRFNQFCIELQENKKAYKIFYDNIILSAAEYFTYETHRMF